MLTFLRRCPTVFLTVLTFSLAGFCYGDKASTQAGSVLAKANLTTVLKVKPNKCIVLHQGQTCYQRLRFSWVVSEGAPYCLFNKTRGEVLLCWQGSRQKYFKYQFESAKSEIFQIRRQGQNKVLAEVKIAVASVYRSKRSSASGWRLF